MKLKTHNITILCVKKILSIIFLLSTFYFLLSPVVVSAQVIGNDFLNGLVPCGTSYANHACTICDFFVLIQNIINFLLFAFAALATLAVVYIAFLFMFSGGSPAKITDAKGKLWLVIIGIFWVLGSWLVLNTILNFMVDKSVFPWPWNQINCSISQPSSSSSTSGGGGAGAGNTNQGFFEGGSSGGGGATRSFELNEQQARSKLQQAGILINKSACPSGASYQNVSGGCTSLDGVKTSTIEEAIQLKNECNCALVITGGTELGHAQGTISHASGNKLDFGLNSTLNQYIQSNFTPIGVRSDGAIQYRAPDGTLYAREGDHWDVTVISL